MERLSALLRRLVVLQPGEAPALLASFATLLCMFASYTILRPVRDALGITSGLEKIPYLFWGVFIVMLVLQPLYGWLTSRFPRAVFLPWVYGFFIANLLGFYVWFRLGADRTWIARTYFVWVSVFNLFVVAAFWSLMADLFTREQAGRVLGFIWAGASTGGLAPDAAAVLRAAVQMGGPPGHAGVGAGHHDRGLCAGRSGARLHGARGGVRGAPGRGLRADPAVPRRAVHGGEPRGEVQGQEPHRYLRVPRRRCLERLALQGAHRLIRSRSCGHRLAGSCDLGAVERAGARPRQGSGAAPLGDRALKRAAATFGRACRATPRSRAPGGCTATPRSSLARRARLPAARSPRTRPAR